MNIELINYVKKYKVKLVPFLNNENSLINQKVKQIYVINLIQDTRKRNYIILLMKKYGINFNLVIVDKIPNESYKSLCENSLISISEFGCCVSHMWCLANIISNNYENAIIFEDDIILHKDFVNKFVKVYDNNPTIDFLLLGAHDFNFSKYNHKNIKNELYRPNKDSVNLYGAHANYYSFAGAKRMFYIRSTNLSFFDNEYILLFNTMPNSFICYPNLAISNINESGLNHEKNVLSNNEKLYYQSCFLNFKFKHYNYICCNLLDIELLNKSVNYETYIDKCLYNYFYDFDKIKIVKNRFVMNFFTLQDIKQILSTQTIIEPNNLSKKCIGEKS
jgi:glycosyl transferase family 25